ncbi:MAG: OB-fold nucleic acid binding domain-containing protein [Candidatus Nanoarchaeia archaeon]
MDVRKRLPAKRTWISHLIMGSYHKSEGWTPGYVEFENKTYSRVSIIAIVVGKFISEDGNYGTITLDDGTETIRVKTFGPEVLKLKDLEIGAIVKCVGKVRQYDNEIYISPEFIRNLDDPNWLIVNKLQLGAPKVVPAPESVKPIISEQEAKIQIETEALTVQGKMIALIKKLDKGLGAPLNEIIDNFGLAEDETKAILLGLLKSGDIYEPKKGFYKILE